MKDQVIIDKLEKDTSVLWKEWKEIVILTSLTTDSSVEKDLKNKFDLDEKYIKFICKKFLENKHNCN